MKLFKSPRAYHMPEPSASVILECCTSMTIPVGAFDVRAVDFTVRHRARQLAAVFGKQALPLAMPRSFVLPPRAAVPATAMGAVVHDARR